MQLLASYNGAQYIEAQVRSLAENNTPFTLHWLDDHSADHTKEVVRSSALEVGIELREWHQAQHLGVPGSFFQLVECAEADLYLFCDQDDIWQPGKIDATVSALLPDVASPTLCFTDALLFNDAEPGVLRRFSDHIAGATIQDKLGQSRMFWSPWANGNSQGFTRPLREIFLRHKAIARSYAFMHDWWMYNLAVASGDARALSDAPTALWRQHGKSFCGGLRRELGNRFYKEWVHAQFWRRVASKHAEGFILASPTMPPSRKLEQLLECARRVAAINRRQSPTAVVGLLRRDILGPGWRNAAWLAAASLCSAATPSGRKRCL